jgi:hypothetical protein
MVRFDSVRWSSGSALLYTHSSTTDGLMRTIWLYLEEMLGHYVLGSVKSTLIYEPNHRVILFALRTCVRHKGTCKLYVACKRARCFFMLSPPDKAKTPRVALGDDVHSSVYRADLSARQEYFPLCEYVGYVVNVSNSIHVHG